MGSPGGPASEIRSRSDSLSRGGSAIPKKPPHHSCGDRSFGGAQSSPGHSAGSQSQKTPALTTERRVPTVEGGFGGEVTIGTACLSRGKAVRCSLSMQSKRQKSNLRVNGVDRTSLNRHPAMLTKLKITSALVLALAHSTGARAQLMIEQHCDATLSHCVILVGPPGSAETVFIPLIGGARSEFRCTMIREEQVWPTRPPMRNCKLWD